MIDLKVKHMTVFGKTPSYGHGDIENAGIDIFSSENRIIWPKCKAVMHTDISAEPSINPDYPHHTPAWFKTFLKNNFKPALFIKSRSGLSVKHSIEHGAGVVDSGYRGELRIILHNHGWLPKRIKMGDRVAQIVPQLIPNCSVEKTSFLRESVRGDKGFGSSDKKK